MDMPYDYIAHPNEKYEDSFYKNVSLFVVTVLLSNANINILFSSFLLFCFSLALYLNILYSKDFSFLANTFLYVSSFNFFFMTCKMMINMVTHKEAFINKCELL